LDAVKKESKKMVDSDEKVCTLMTGNFFCDQGQRGILKSKPSNNSGLQIVVWVLCKKSNLYLVRINKLSLPRLPLADI
jgi:hypothetical protein